MNAQFQYKGFEADSSVRLSANQLFSYLKGVAPTDATIIARTEYDGTEYGCSIDLFFLNSASIYAFTTGTNAVAAIGKAAARIEEQLRN